MTDGPANQRKLAAIQKKARERTVKTQTIEYDLETLSKRIKNNLIKLDPDYQRRHRWSIETSSKLIESLILNIPIPVISYLLILTLILRSAAKPLVTQ